MRGILEQVTIILVVSLQAHHTRMSYITIRREEEKERRRAEVLDAAEILYAKKGWDELTVDQVARSARLSRGYLI
jgi:AcrR family transcriptional regulator